MWALEILAPFSSAILISCIPPGVLNLSQNDSVLNSCQNGDYRTTFRILRYGDLPKIQLAFAQEMTSPSNSTKGNQLGSFLEAQQSESQVRIQPRPRYRTPSRTHSTRLCLCSMFAFQTKRSLLYKCSLSYPCSQWPIYMGAQFLTNSSNVFLTLANVFLNFSAFYLHSKLNLAATQLSSSSA